MKKLILMLVPVLACFVVSPAIAKDVQKSLSIQNAINNEKVKQSLNPEIALYWGNQPHPEISKNYGEFKTSKRTNAFGKSDETACQWALATALKVLQDKAIREGGNAVINIKSNINNIEISDPSNFQCLAGAVMVNVAVKGTVVLLKK